MLRALPLLALVGCAHRAEPPPLDVLRDAERVDLTWTFDASTITWPTSPSGFEAETLSWGETPGGWFYASRSFCAPEHGGTHLDAPVHFAEQGRTADAVPLDQLIGPAVVIDLPRAAEAPDATLTVADVDAWEEAHGPVPEGAIALLRTGWGARWPDRRAYLGDDTPGDASHLHFPSFGVDAVDRLLERGVVAIGVDTASIDPGVSRDFPVHRMVGAADVPAFENVAHLEALPATGAWVVALPMKIGGGSGGPARVIALLPPVPPDDDGDDDDDAPARAPR